MPFPYQDEALRQMTPRAYPQTVEGNLAYAVDRMLVAEAEREYLKGVLRLLLLAAKQGGAVSYDEMREALDSVRSVVDMREDGA